VCVGFDSVEIGEPSPKSHSKRIESPGSGSDERSLEKFTVSGDYSPDADGSQAVSDAAEFGGFVVGVVCVTISPVESFTSVTVCGE
jgi:hypothetical protein